MTISFFEPGDIPKPPDEVKIELLELEPYPDKWRVKLRVNVTPFQIRPNLEIVLRRVDEGSERPVANLSIIETMHPRMEFTMHIRGVADPVGEYRLTANLYYRDEMKEGEDEPPPPVQKDARELQLTIA